MKRYLMPFLISFGLLLTACEKGEESSSVPTELIVTDVPQSSVTQPQIFPLEIDGVEIKAEAQRVVSLSPAVTEIIAELGFADRLFGISTYCDYPELTVQRVGSAENPDIDMLTALEADVVFSLSALSERDVYALEEKGTAVICLDTPCDIDSYGVLYENIASVFIGSEAAKNKALTAVEALKTSADGAFSGSYIYISPKMTAAGVGTFENAVLSLCGENLCASEGYSELLSLGEIQPDYIIAADTLSYNDIAYDDVLSVYVYNGAKVLFVPSARFERPSARTSEVFSAISEQLTSEE
ncbi:MAG: ABC transporter substrate-binding protein [Oscillospiraceae bacterium]|nr:ABC transporter substrate-binding protein [Oscillospiraceae bacterium]